MSSMIVAFAALSFQAAEPLPLPAEIPSAAAEVGVVIDKLHLAAAQADGATYFELFTPDARFIGTDVAERWSITEFRAYAEPYFAKGQGWAYTSRSRTISITSDPCACQAWFDEVLDSQSYGTARGSGVLTRTADGWRIAQYVLSFPIPNDIADGVTDQIKAYEANAAATAASTGGNRP